jgi:hypothetical protein
MARRPTLAQFYTALEARYGQAIADAFLAAIEDLRSAAELQRAVTAVQAGDAEALIAALHLDPAAFAPMLDQISAAYQASGQGATSYLPALRDAVTGARFVLRFNARNPRAEAWLRNHSATLVTRILDDQRAAARTALAAGLARGDNPTQTALDIIGRMDKTTGSRVGGIIGLTPQQAGFVQNARAELESADPADLRAYLDRTLRDQRFDRSVAKAIREGTALPADIQARALVGYERKLLKYRGDLIGKNETFSALGAGKDEAYRQAINSGALNAAVVTKTWRHFPNEHPRTQHIAMNGKSVGFNEAFVLPDGTRMQYPHEPGAPIGHTAGCHCQADYRIDFLAALGPQSAA